MSAILPMVTARSCAAAQRSNSGSSSSRRKHSASSSAPRATRMSATLRASMGAIGVRFRNAAQSPAPFSDRLKSQRLARSKRDWLRVPPKALSAAASAGRHALFTCALEPILAGDSRTSCRPSMTSSAGFSFRGPQAILGARAAASRRRSRCATRPFPSPPPLAVDGRAAHRRSSTRSNAPR